MDNVPLHIADLGGGMIDGIPPLDIADNQFENLVNWYPFGTKIVRRLGSALITLVPAAAAITALETFADAASHYVIAGLLNGFSWNNAGVMTAIPKIDTPFYYPSEGRPWSMLQYKTEMFAVRPGEVLQRLTAASAVNAGIAVPTAPGVVVGGAGGVTAGDHAYFVTYLTTTGNESPESDETVVTCAVDSAVTITLPISPLGRVTERRLWRSLSNDAGQLYLVDRITDNVTTTYVDNVPDADLGAPFEYGNRLPPTTPCRAITSWNQRLWLIDDNALYATKTGRFETFDQDFEGFSQYSGHVLRAVHAWGTRLILAATKKIFSITQTGVDESGVRFDIEEFSDEHGCVSHHSMQSAEGRLFWFAGDNVYMSNGGQPISITTWEIRKILDRAKANAARWEYACAKINTDLGWYALSLSVDSATRNDYVLVFNYKTSRWHVFRHFTEWVAPSALTEFYDANFSRVTYAAFADGNIYQLNSGTRDGTNKIRALARTKAFQRPNYSSVFRKLQINCTTAPEFMTVRLFRDGPSETNPIHERSIYLSNFPNPERDWKRIALAGAGANKTTVPRLKSRSFQVEMDYTGDSVVEVNELLLEVDTYEMTRRAI